MKTKVDPDMVAADWPYVGMEHLDPGSPRVMRNGSPADVTSLVSVFEPGDVLFGRLRPYLRKVARADVPGVCTPEILVLRPTDVTVPGFTYLVAASDACIEHAVKHSAGSRMPRASAADLASFPLALPPLDEQRRIVDVVTGVDSQIEALESEQECALTALSSTRHNVFRRESDRRLFKNVAQLQRGYDLPVQDRADGTIPVIASNGPVGFHDTAMVEGPGVVTGRSGTIGKVLFCEHAFWPLNTTLFVKDFKGNDPLFIKHMLLSMNLPSHAGGSTVPSLNRNVLDDVSVYRPDTLTQSREAGALDAIEALTASTNRSLASIRAFRSTLLKALFSQSIAIPESYDALLD